MGANWEDLAEEVSLYRVFVLVLTFLFSIISKLSDKIKLITTL